MTNYVVPMIVMGIVVLYSLFMLSKQRQAMRALDGMGDTWRGFFERSGYRYHDLAQQPIGAHIARAQELMRAAMKNPCQRYHMVRRVDGFEVMWIQETRTTGRGAAMTCSWSAQLSPPPRVRWQIAERSLSGAGKLAKEFMSSSERTWRAEFPLRVTTGDADLDGRFQVFAEDERATLQVLATPGLKQALLAMKMVDLRVRADHVIFDDPDQSNLRAALGGSMGMLAKAGDPTKVMELSIPVHDRIASLLCAAAKASV